MAANHNVVIVKEAQDIKKIDDILPYFSNPTPTSIVVICYKYKKISKKAFIEKINKIGVVFDAKSLYDNQIPQWITKYLAEKGFPIDVHASTLLAENLGSDLSKIVNELGKLMINLPAGTKVTPEIVEENIGISKDFNVFELNKALSYRDVVKANRIVNYFAANPNDHPMVLVIGQLNAHFTKILLYNSLKDKSKNNAASALGINAFFLNDYIKGGSNFPINKLYEVFGLLREFDMRSKGVNNESATTGDLLRELIFKILH
jgi:DNA polymerase-3 subunit delta